MALIQSTAIPNAGGYKIKQSLRFNDNDSAYLSKTFASAGNRKTWTWSAWVKRGNLVGSGTRQVLFSGTGTTHTTFGDIRFDPGDDLHVGTYTTQLILTNNLFRDPSAWYHIVVAMDTTQGTVSNRLKVYVNGVEPSLAVDNRSSLSQNTDYGINSAVEHAIGRNEQDNNWYLDGYLGEVNFIDGQALTPADFGETGDYGEWKPTAYTGSYGTNGFYLNFAGGGIMSATGGTITTDGDYKVHSFTSNGTFTPTVTGYTQSDVEYLIIAGGGGGGHSDGSNVRAGGGGGAGGYRTGFLGVTSSTGYSITVGAGGTGGSGSYSSAATAGANSVFSSITSTGGGGGKGHSGAANNSTGGSGGGGSWNATSGGSASPAGQGNAGGTGGDNHPNHGGGGGGGAGAAGSNANYSSGVGGNGGAGSASSITGSSVTRAGGGGGAGNSDKGVGGSGGGGNGQIGNAGAGASHGTANTGGGGGGASGGADYGGNGGSGIVILRYKFQ